MQNPPYKAIVTLQEIKHKLQRQHDNNTHVGKQDSFNMTFRMFRDVSSDMTGITD